MFVCSRTLAPQHPTLYLPTLTRNGEGCLSPRAGGNSKKQTPPWRRAWRDHPSSSRGPFEAPEVDLLSDPVLKAHTPHLVRATSFY